MTNPEIIFVNDFLAHYSEGYDPVKAKAYYERTKVLKGRRRGRSVTSAVRTVDGSTIKTRSTVSGLTTSNPLTPAQRAAKRAEASKARVESIKKKMAQMQKHLDNLRSIRTEKLKSAAASKKESSKKDSKTKETSSTKDKEPAKKLTAAEKAEKARKAREAYEPVKKDPSSMSVDELDKQIAKTRERMTQLRTDLKRIMANAPGRSSVSDVTTSRTAGQGR
jgi:chromosome segregation ATPase